MVDARSPGDAAPPDASTLPLPGFGAISGDCDVLDVELTAPAPALVRSAIDFERAYTAADLSALTPGGAEIIADDNAGGSSLYSEVFAYEVLARCERAALLKTETEIDYNSEGKITDLLVDIDAVRIGVSVTRAVAFPFDDPYPLERARDLLYDKLWDVRASSALVAPHDRWWKQILVVVAFGPGHGDVLEQAYADLGGATRGDTIVWIIVTDGADDFVYCDGPCS